MQDEIKEILDIMKYNLNEKQMGYHLGIYQLKVLLDYITNLQETKDNMEQELQELYLIKDNLQEENNKKDELIKKYDSELTHKTNQYEFLRHNESKELRKYKRYVDETFLYTYEELQDKVINLQKEIERLKGE